MKNVIAVLVVFVGACSGARVDLHPKQAVVLEEEITDFNRFETALAGCNPDAVTSIESDEQALALCQSAMDIAEAIPLSSELVQGVSVQALMVALKAYIVASEKTIELLESESEEFDAAINAFPQAFLQDTSYVDELLRSNAKCYSKAVTNEQVVEAVSACMKALEIIGQHQYLNSPKVKNGLRKKLSKHLSLTML